MTGVQIPLDRTTKQMVRARCYNPECRDVSESPFEFDIEHDHFACPKCGADKEPMVFMLTLTHLMIRDARGPIQGNHFRYRLACEPKRAHLATRTNNEAATDDPKVANCIACLERARLLGIIKPTGIVLGAK